MALGPGILPLWLGNEFSNIGRPLLACYGLYFVAHVQLHLNHAMRMGTGQVSKLVGIQLLESGAIAASASHDYRARPCYLVRAVIRDAR